MIKMGQNQEEHYIPKTLEECLKMDKEEESCLVEMESIVRGVIYYKRDKFSVFHGYLQRNDSLVKFHLFPSYAPVSPILCLLKASSEGDILISVKGKYDPFKAELVIHSLSFGVYDYSVMFDK